MILKRDQNLVGCSTTPDTQPVKRLYWSKLVV